MADDLIEWRRQLNPHDPRVKGYITWTKLRQNQNVKITM